MERAAPDLPGRGSPPLRTHQIGTAGEKSAVFADASLVTFTFLSRLHCLLFPGTMRFAAAARPALAAVANFAFKVEKSALGVPPTLVPSGMKL